MAISSLTPSCSNMDVVFRRLGFTFLLNRLAAAPRMCFCFRLQLILGFRYLHSFCARITLSQRRWSKFSWSFSSIQTNKIDTNENHQWNVQNEEIFPQFCNAWIKWSSILTEIHKNENFTAKQHLILRDKAKLEKSAQEIVWN